MKILEHPGSEHKTTCEQCRAVLIVGKSDVQWKWNMSAWYYMGEFHCPVCDCVNRMAYGTVNPAIQPSPDEWREEYLKAHKLNK